MIRTCNLLIRSRLLGVSGEAFSAVSCTKACRYFHELAGVYVRSVTLLVTLECKSGTTVSLN